MKVDILCPLEFPMFDDYTRNQLLELRNICLSTVERDSTKEETADALLLLEYIDQELVDRERLEAA
jgi:hypothetical protein